MSTENEALDLIQYLVQIYVDNDNQSIGRNGTQNLIDTLARTGRYIQPYTDTDNTTT